MSIYWDNSLCRFQTPGMLCQAFGLTYTPVFINDYLNRHKVSVIISSLLIRQQILDSNTKAS